jgi:parallel beta helix pectate lyase-like protein
MKGRMNVRRTAVLAVLAAVVPSVGVGEGQAGGGVPIFACGQTVFQNAFVTTDLLDCPGNAIVVGADGVTIDLKGFTVDGKRFGTGVRADGFERVTVKNGVVRDFDVAVSITGREASVSDVVLSGNYFAGVVVLGDEARIQSATASANQSGFLGPAIYVAGDAAKIRSSTASGNAGWGIWVDGDSASVKSASATGNGEGGIRVNGEAAKIKGNRADGNGFGAADNSGLGILATGYSSSAPPGRNVARGNDDLDECDPAWLC